ncbi:MAG TPA: ABC transporter substrate-binding protein, partial [Thermoplasmata archaeon]|nr:ABC transporter substrate-binding protein [Thermoplasmata archaeon]
MEKKLIAAIVTIVVIIAAVGAALVLTSNPQTSQSVGYVTMPVGSMKDALGTNSSIGGYIAWEPFDSDGIVSGVGHALEWSGEVRPNHVCCVVLVSDAFLASPQGPNLTIRFLKAHVEATEWMNAALGNKSSANYTLLVDMAVNFTGRNATVIKAALEHMKFTTAITQQAIDDISWYTQQF